MIIDDYISYSNQYKQKYGEKCVVLMQVGSFYELYSIDDDTSNDIYHIADLCNIQISKKNKSITEVSISNPLMAGFPLYTLKKYTGILLNHNYTIVLVEQVTEPPNPERKITEILSPGMNINVENKKNNYMMVLYFEYIDDLPVVGIAGMDLSTGKSFVYEAGSSKQDPEFTNDEVFRMMATYNPREVIVMSNKKYQDVQKNYLIKNINRANILIHYLWDTYEYMSHMNKVSYQNNILEKAFRKKTMLSVTEMLNMERYQFARIALCCLLQFAYEHNVDIVHNLTVPEIINDTKFLNIEFNSAMQLNIVGTNANEKPLVDILNRCCTPFGSRMFREKLLNPIIDASSLMASYDAIDFAMKDGKYVKIMKHLRNILDVERIKRKMQLNKMNPQDWASFKISIESAISVLKDYYDYDVGAYEDMLSYLTGVIDIAEASKYNLADIKGNFFNKGVYSDIDKCVGDFDKAYHNIVGIYNYINSIGIGDTTLCKIDYSDRDGYCINMTKKRFDAAIAADHKYMKEFKVKTLTASNNIKLVNKDIIDNTNIMDEMQAIIVKKVVGYYKDFVETFITRYEKEICEIVNHICRIDIACCNARNAMEYRYTRPAIEDCESSFVEANDVRHPIIERIDESVEYIGNDITLRNASTNGMLLYGINAAGKSSLMKSIGLNIVMAQAGMFVAATDMKYHPYKHLFTRISGMDNIYKGMSSFTVEMTELRNILQRCDKYSLVLGDEVCSGTESVSALAIVASGIDVLVKRKAGFIFATHLHDLTNLGIIKQYIDGYICVKHIHIVIDENNRITYERKLRDGKGASTYGIEVCRSLDMPESFMKTAENIRKEIQGDSLSIVSPIVSKYNKELYMTKCALCGNKAEDTHHINYQCNSDENGNFKNFHKNSRHNLIALCKVCHKKQHSGEIDIKRYIKTSEGVTIECEDLTADDVESSDTSHEENDRLNQSDYDILCQYIKKGKTSWFLRKNKNNVFRECSDERKIREKIRTLVNKIIVLDDVLETKFFDPRY